MNETDETDPDGWLRPGRPSDELRAPRIPEIRTLLDWPHRAAAVLCVHPLRGLLESELPQWMDLRFSVGFIVPGWMDIPELASTCEIRVRSTDVRAQIGSAGPLLHRALIRSRRGFVTYRDGLFTASFELHLCLYRRRRRTCSIPMRFFRFDGGRWSADDWPRMPF